MEQKQVRKRRTDFQDFKLQDWHRDFLDYDCPAIDLDLLFLEFDTGEPVALVEYKNEHAKQQRSGHPSYQALIKLGTRAGVPVFAVRYGTRLDWFRVVALNDLAKTYAPEPTTMTPDEYAEFMLHIRGRVSVPSICPQCDGVMVVPHPEHYLDLIDCPTCGGNGIVK